MNGAFAGTTWADQAQLEEWFAGAAAGAQAIYASGPNLDPKHPVKALVDDWVKTGEAVYLPQVRLGPGMFRFAIRRARPVLRQAQDERRRGSKRGSVTADEAWRETADGKVYLALVRAANMGMPCPTNAQLAEIAGLPDADAARYRVKLLNQAHLIKVELSGAGRSFRRVLITETGRWTADEPRSLALPGLMKGHAA